MGANMILQQNIETVSTFWLQLSSFTFFFFYAGKERRGQKAPPMVLGSG